MIMTTKLSWLILCYIFSQVTAVRELKMVYIITGYSYYSSNLIVLRNDSDNKMVLGGELNYELLSFNTKDMPKSQKLGLFNLGSKLRQEYNQLLGSEYNPDKYTMHTSEFTISMMAGLLINAGIWPPMTERQTWRQEFKWQPIPYDYQIMNEDLLLLGTQCPAFQKDLEKVQEHTANETDPVYENLVNYIQNNTELRIRSHVDMIQLFHVLQSMLIEEKSLPPLLEAFYVNGTINSLAIKGFDELSKTLTQKKLNGGTFLKKMLNTFQDITAAQIRNEKVMTIISADDINIAGVVANLKLQYPPNPTTQLALIFELSLNNETNSYEIMIKNQIKDLNMPMISLAMNDCEKSCPFEKFQLLIADVLPKDENDLCGGHKTNTIIEITQTETISIEMNNSARKNSYFNYHLILLSLFIIFSKYLR